MTQTAERLERIAFLRAYAVQLGREAMVEACDIAEAALRQERLVSVSRELDASLAFAGSSGEHPVRVGMEALRSKPFTVVFEGRDGHYRFTTDEWVYDRFPFRDEEVEKLRAVADAAREQCADYHDDHNWAIATFHVLQPLLAELDRA